MDENRIQGKKEKVNDIAGRMKQHVSEWTGEAEKLPDEPKEIFEMPGERRKPANRKPESDLKESVGRPANSKATSPQAEPPGKNPDTESEEDRDWAAYRDRSRRKAS